MRQPRTRHRQGPRHSGAMRLGAFLITTSTILAWTTHFALAPGIVTDVGGPLSHSAIVAREYGITAVIRMGVATARVADGATVVVDGGAETVTLI